jgi:ATP-dependent 26S proteasome regulatory subunit
MADATTKNPRGHCRPGLRYKQKVHVNSREQQGHLRSNHLPISIGTRWDDKQVAKVTEARAKMGKAYEDTLSSISEKEVLMGTVVGMNKKEAVINIGYKSEGVVPLSEFRYKPDLAIGDRVEVYIEKQEDKGGQMVISHKTARVHNAWGKVNSCHGDQ